MNIDITIQEHIPLKIAAEEYIKTDLVTFEQVMSYPQIFEYIEIAAVPKENINIQIEVK